MTPPWHATAVARARVPCDHRFDRADDPLGKLLGACRGPVAGRGGAERFTWRTESHAPVGAKVPLYPNEMVPLQIDHAMAWDGT